MPWDEFNSGITDADGRNRRVSGEAFGPISMGWNPPPSRTRELWGHPKPEFRPLKKGEEAATV